MAVHPADDGSLVIDDAPRGATSTLSLISLALVAVIVAALGVLVYGLLTDSDTSADASPDNQSVRDAVMSQADQFVLRANSYGPADLDENNAMPGYAERVREVITPKFAVSFDESLTLAEQTVSGAGYARDVDLYASGVESIDADNATVLVAGVFNGSYPDSSADAEDSDRIEFEPQPFRFKVMLVKSDETWLVDDFSPLTSEIIDPGAESPDGTDGTGDTSTPAPSEEPTVAPTRTPTRTPSGGAGR